MSPILRSHSSTTFPVDFFCLRKNVHYLHTIKIVDISKKNDKVNPNPAAAVQRFGIFQKLKSEVILYLFEQC